MAQMKKQNFLQGAAVLTASMLIVKMVGALFKLPLGNVLMESGMAYFNASYNLFIAIYALTVTGLTTAVARMVAACAIKKRYRDCVEILRIARRIFIILGIAGTLIMIVGSKAFANMANLESSVYAIIVMAPAIFFSCMMATYRGYYEGMRNMIPSAVSQVVEVVVKLIVGLLFAFATMMIGENMATSTGKIFWIVLENGVDSTTAQIQSVLLPLMAAGAMAGVTCSTLFGFLYMRWCYHRTGTGFTKEELAASPKSVSDREITMQLLKSALPITISAVVTNLTSLVDLFTIIDRLDYAIQSNSEYFQSVYGQYVGEDEDMASYIYGGYTMASPIYNLVPAFTAIFAKSALPNITGAWVSKDRHALTLNISSMVRMTSIIAFPAGLGLLILGPEIATLLYPSVAGAAVSVGIPLQVSGIAAIFLSLVSPLYAVLQSLGRFDLPVKFTLVGATVKIATNYTLVGIPEINIAGAAIGTTLCNVIILTLSLLAVVRITGANFPFASIFARNFAAAALCGATAFGISLLGDGRTFTLLAIIGAMGMYVIGILFFKALTEEDVMMMPKGGKILPVLKKYRWVQLKK